MLRNLFADDGLDFAAVLVVENFIVHLTGLELKRTAEGLCLLLVEHRSWRHRRMFLCRHQVKLFDVLVRRLGRAKRQERARARVARGRVRSHIEIFASFDRSMPRGPQGLYRRHGLASFNIHLGLKPAIAVLITYFR